MQPQYRRIEKIPNIRINEEDPDLISHYIDINKTIPSYVQIEGCFQRDKFFEFLKAKYADDHLVSWQFEIASIQQAVIQIKIGRQVVFLRTGRTRYIDRGFIVVPEKDKKFISEKGIMCFYDFDLLYDIKEGRPDELINQLKSLSYKNKSDGNKIHLICNDPDIGMYTKEFSISSSEYDFDLDLHYGDGMSDFHEKQVRRLVTGSKGIILLYGDPGTGKTFYIKRLCSDLSKANKKILYLPSNMVDQIGTPNFNNFLIEWVDDNSDGPKKSVLIIIEDGERILLKRENNPYGADGVSNILNSTDGIMNDFLNIQVLATFNTDLKNIDEAILRKKRSLGIREFKKLEVEEAQKLIDSLKIDYRATDKMSLADIYSLFEEEDDEVLMKDNKPASAKKIGFK
jgi:hypothetical protein